jgi:hypothetical protein
LTQEIFGRLTATDMELIYWSEIIDCYRIDRLTKRFNAAADRSNEVAMRVMVGNILLSWHGSPPEQGLVTKSASDTDWPQTEYFQIVGNIRFGSFATDAAGIASFRFC